MEKRLGSQISPSLSMEDLRTKLLHIVRKHEESKTAFHQLKSQIKISLLEAQDVFASLSIPLMRLVGLKTEELAYEGRSACMIMESNLQRQYVQSVAGSENNTRRSDPMDRELRQRESTEESYSSRAAKACREIEEKQRLQLQQLVFLLRQIETRVNSHHDTILQSLDDHRLSLNRLFKKAFALLSATHHRSAQALDQTPLLISFKIVQATFEQVDSTLGSVEDDVETLVQELAEQMCAPMMAHVKGLRDEMAGGGASARLVGVVEEMVRVVRDGRVELEEARKRAKVEEEGKVEALRRLREYEEKLRGMKEFVGLFLDAKRWFKKLSLPMSNKLLAPEKDQTSDDKLLWDLLKKNKRMKKQASPINGATATDLYFPPNNIATDMKRAGSNSYNISTRESSSRKHSQSPQPLIISPSPRPTVRIYPRKLSQGPSFFPRLGTSPSSVDLHGATTHSRRGRKYL